jgi:hypothetical protein
MPVTRWGEEAPEARRHPAPRRPSTLRSQLPPGRRQETTLASPTTTLTRTSAKPSDRKLQTAERRYPGARERHHLGFVESAVPVALGSLAGGRSAALHAGRANAVPPQVPPNRVAAFGIAAISDPCWRMARPAMSAVRQTLPPPAGASRFGRNGRSRNLRVRAVLSAC